MSEVDDHWKIANELERKYLEVLANLTADHESGAIGTAELKVAWKAVYDTISGLLPWSLVNEMQEAFDQHIEDAEMAPRATVQKSRSMGLRKNNTRTRRRTA